MIYLLKENIWFRVSFFFLATKIFFSGAALANLQAENRLNWVEVTKGAFSTQIMFDFAKPIIFSKKLDEKKFSLKLSFPGMDLHNFKHDYAIKQLQKLKQAGIMQKATIFEKEKPVQQVILALNFAETNLNKKNSKNRLLIKWSKLDNPNRLIIDIFTKKQLSKLKRNEALFLQAHNNTIISDSPKKNFAIDNLNINRDIRVVIDAGHGGRQPGAERFGLQEKNIALDIAQRVRGILKKSGFNALLTRSTDTTMSLKERSELASQLKADLFVSIHVNSTPTNQASDRSGIETFYLNDEYHFPSKTKSGFILMNLKNHLNYPRAVNSALHKKIKTSKALAASIQNNLVANMENKKFNVKNRGVKTAGFRVLLRSEVPSALVEVGFLSNKNEASKLAQAGYRSHLAEGISLGIKKYLLHQK